MEVCNPLTKFVVVVVKGILSIVVKAMVFAFELDKLLLDYKVSSKLDLD